MSTTAKMIRSIEPDENEVPARREHTRAGQDQNYTGKPWEPMPQSLAIAEYITKTHAICMKCGQPANYTQRTFESEERVAVGGAGMYEARCRSCFVPHADAPTMHDE